MNAPLSRHTTWAIRSTRRLTAVWLTVLILFTAAGAYAQAAPGKSSSTMAVSVNGQEQPGLHAELLLSDQLARGAVDSPALRAQVREAVINQALMAQAAQGEKLHLQPDVRARVAMAEQSALALEWQKKVLRNVRITEEDVAAEYERQVQALGNREVQLRHALLPDEPQARRVLSQLAEGAAFETLAMQVSRDTSTRERGGLSDWVPLGSLAPSIVQALKGIEPGQLVAQPVQTPSGWQVIKVEGLRPFSPPPIESVRARLRQTLEQRALRASLQALRDNARVE